MATLRKRKQRGDKPFALMVADLDAAERLLVLDDAERALLASRRAADRAAPGGGPARSPTASPRAATTWA